MKKISVPKPKIQSVKPAKPGAGKLKVVAAGGKVLDPGYFKKNPITKARKI